MNERYLQEAADRVMIHELHARYAYALDYPSEGPDELGKLFTESGRLVIPEISMVIERRAALRSLPPGSTRPSQAYTTSRAISSSMWTATAQREDVN